jgi:hypothetical protein
MPPAWSEMNCSGGGQPRKAAALSGAEIETRAGF